MLGLKRKNDKKIGIVTATLFAIGSVVGGGVFALSGTAVQLAGPAALLSFVFAGMVVLFSALSLAIVAGKTPAGEAGYDEIGDILGGSARFVVSWCFYLNAVIVTGFVLNAFGVYFHEFVMKNLSTTVAATIAAVIIGGLNFLPAWLIGRAESAMVWVKLLALSLLVVVGIPHLTNQDFMPFFSHGFSGAMSAGSTLFIAFLGFNVITNISSEIRNASRAVPRAIVASMVAVMIIYIGVVLAMLAAHLSSYNEASVGQAAVKLAGPIGGIAVIIGALLATLSAANANMLGASETIMRMAMKKTVPSFLARPWRSHPIVSVSIGVVVAIGLVTFHLVATAVDLANILAIIALIIIDFAAIKLFLHEGKRAKLLLVIPIFGIVGAASQLFYLPGSSLVWAGSFVVLGLAMYGLREVLTLHSEHVAIREVIKEKTSPLVAVLRR